MFKASRTRGRRARDAMGAKPRLKQRGKQPETSAAEAGIGACDLERSWSASASLAATNQVSDDLE